MSHLTFVKIVLFVIFIRLVALVMMCPKKAHSDQVITKELALCVMTPLKNFGLCKDFTVGSQWEKGFAGNLPAESRVFHIETLDNCDSDGWLIFREIGDEIVLWEMVPPDKWLASQPKNLIIPTSAEEIAREFVVAMFQKRGKAITEVDDWLRVKPKSVINGIAVFDFCTSLEVKGFSSEVELWVAPVSRQSGAIVYEIIKVEVKFLNY
ncbi:MAG: hypothetical protein Athens101428_278 [Candidatus Berkelbacteria bacterium Athens1014_28]|uniref:Uncharacterized protein n=1 Tax=Candidatus Berkelbacteria bacterium Athens1014_28 TaxID=2017145 RepID=A0A554LNL4_9BACT|nr:MAG: hypothetical protein Athens101428_278 [Candidatus Berkelbacteria bacterium Athens1014_28]